MEQATLVTPEQVIAFLGVAGVLVVANLGQLVSWALNAYKRKIKDDIDLNEAFKRIREIEKQINELKKGKI